MKKSEPPELKHHPRFDFQFNLRFSEAAGSRNIAGWQPRADRVEDSTLGPGVPSAQASHPVGLAEAGLERRATSLLSFQFKSGKLRCLQHDPHRGCTANTCLGNLLPTTGQPISPGLASKHPFPIHYSCRQSRPRRRRDAVGSTRSS